MKASLFHSSALRILTPAVLILAVGAAARADDPRPADGRPGRRPQILLVLPGVVNAFGVVYSASGPVTLTPDDANAMFDPNRCPSIIDVAPIVRVRPQVIYNGKNWQPNTTYGTTSDFLFVRNWNTLVDGIPFGDQDVASQAEVCVLGQTVVKQLFDKVGPGDDITDYESPVGKEIRINNKPFKVVGVLSAKGANTLGQDQDDIVLAPWTTVKFKLAPLSAAPTQTTTTSSPTNDTVYPRTGSPALYPTPSPSESADMPVTTRFVNVDQVLVQVRSQDEIESAEKEITDLLRVRHHLRSGDLDDFQIRAGMERIYDPKPADGKSGFRTEAVVHKNLTATVDATGTVEPEEVIDIGAQVSGLIQKFGPADPAKPDGPVVDYATAVKKGQTLAVIDPALYEGQVKQAKAALASARAVLKKAVVNCDALRNVYQREKDNPAAIPQAQLAADKAAWDLAAAECDIQEAAVAQVQANLDEANANVSYCTIIAPVDGVIVDRRVNVGQTVVASLSAPSLFLLAKDLTKMQVWVAVNEADIGAIHGDQEATFTVDARPGKTYAGKVRQIRLNASMEHDVVTYTVVVDADNPVLTAPEKGKTTPAAERELLPYLTAHVTFHVAERKDALAAPNAALRWKPQLQQVDPKFRDEYEQLLRKKAAQGSKPGAQVGTPGLVWVQDGAFVRPIRLVIGLTDGAMTEVVSVHEGDTLDEGTAVVTGEGRAGDATDPKPLPLVPKKIKDDK